MELLRKARGVELPENFWTDPLMYQGGSDHFLGPRDPIRIKDIAWGADFEGELAVVVDDVPLGVSENQAEQHIQMILLVNDISLRNLIPEELAKGFGFVHGKPPSAFGPVAVTKDMIGESWRDGKVNLHRLVKLLFIRFMAFKKRGSHLSMVVVNTIKVALSLICLGYRHPIFKFF